LGERQATIARQIDTFHFFFAHISSFIAMTDHELKDLVASLALQSKEFHFDCISQFYPQKNNAR